MSLIDMQDHMLTDLQSAFDMGKIMSVFSSFLSVIRDQQAQMDALNQKFESGGGGSRKAKDEDLARRVDELESKVDDFILTIQGNGTINPSILHGSEMTGMEAFEKSMIGVVPILDQPHDDAIELLLRHSSEIPDVVAARSRPPSAFIRPSPRFNPDDNDEEEEEEQAETEYQQQQEEEEEEENIDQIASVEPFTTQPPLPVIGEDDGSVTSLEPQPPLTVTQAEPTLTSETENLEIPEEPVSLDAALHQALKVVAETGISTPFETADIPSSEDNTSRGMMSKLNLEERPSSGSGVSRRHSAAPLSSSNSSSRASSARITRSSTGRINPSSVTINTEPATILPLSPTRMQHPYLNKMTTSKSRKSVIFRREMSLHRLNHFLTPDRIKRIVKELKTRGRFLLISRRMLEDTRKKYANQSLKHKIEFLEADIMRLYTRIDVLRETVKRNNMTLREGLPKELREILVDLELLLSAVDKFGGVIPFTDFLSTLKDVDLKALTPDGKDEFYQSISQHLQDTILNAQNAKLNEQLSEQKRLLQETTTKVELSNMLKVTAATELNTDTNHLKLLNVIDKATKMPLESLEKTRMESERKIHHQLVEAKEHALKLKEEAEYVSQKYADARVKAVLDEFYRTRELDHQQSLEMHEEMVLVRAKMAKVDAERQSREEEMIKMEDSRLKEHEQLKILQRRIANLNIDKIVDELKVVKEDVLGRPSTIQVQKMIAKIEGTFKHHLGDNVQGMTNLVTQVYKFLQTKVDRDDIKNLISARLAQMENELIYREEELFDFAASAKAPARCLSCGQMPMSSKAKYREPRPLSRPSVAAGTAAKSRESSPNRGELTTPTADAEHQHEVMDDESTGTSPPKAHHHSKRGILANPGNYHAPTVAQTPAYSEEVTALLTGQMGLRSLHLQHAPLQPVRDPFHTAANSNRPKTVQQVPEPLFRRAAVAQQVKEMVKVQVPLYQQQHQSAMAYQHMLSQHTLPSPQQGGVFEQNSISTLGSVGMLGGPRKSQAIMKNSASAVLMSGSLNNTTNFATAASNGNGSSVASTSPARKSFTGAALGSLNDANNNAMVNVPSIHSPMPSLGGVGTTDHSVASTPKSHGGEGMSVRRGSQFDFATVEMAAASKAVPF